MLFRTFAGYIKVRPHSHPPWPIPMKYEPIDELNISDAARHLEDARRMNDQERIRIARTQLQNQLDLVKETKPNLYQKYLNLLE